MKKLILESFGITALLLLILKLGQLFISPKWISLLVPVLLLYLPFAILAVQKKPIDFIDRSFRQFWLGLAAFLITVLIVFPPYMLAAHYWMIHVFHFDAFNAAPIKTLWDPLPYQILAVAIPEEFYFRGYLQPLMNKIWKPKWRLFGANLGWGWIITALVFAFAHSIIQLQWWHFSIFFPALLFGYLKEKTGSITAPILFHAFSNAFMNWFSKSYF